MVAPQNVEEKEDGIGPEAVHDNSAQTAQKISFR